MHFSRSLEGKERLEIGLNLEGELPLLLNNA